MAVCLEMGSDEVRNPNLEYVYYIGDRIAMSADAVMWAVQTVIAIGIVTQYSKVRSPLPTPPGSALYLIL